MTDSFVPGKDDGEVKLMNGQQERTSSVLTRRGLLKRYLLPTIATVGLIGAGGLFIGSNGSAFASTANILSRDTTGQPMDTPSASPTIDLTATTVSLQAAADAHKQALITEQYNQALTDQIKQQMAGYAFSQIPIWITALGAVGVTATGVWGWLSARADQNIHNLITDLESNPNKVAPAASLQAHLPDRRGRYANSIATATKAVLKQANLNESSTNALQELGTAAQAQVDKNPQKRKH